MNKKALSPLVATLLLLGFGLALGFVVMSLEKSLLVGSEMEDEGPAIVCFEQRGVDDPLKVLQIKYLDGQITKQEYLQKESALLGT